MNSKAISILVIDGDTASRNYLSIMLRKSGYGVLSAPLGREGLILAWRDRPDIIIFDPGLPDVTGLEVLTRLRQDQRTVKVPVVALSSQADSLDKGELLSADCNEYVAKSDKAVSKLLELIPGLVKGDPTSSGKRGILEVFLSAKGGTGTSSLCANIAMCLGSEKIENRVAVIDLVLPIGSIANIVGYTDKLNIVTVAREGSTLTTSAYFKDHLPRIPNWYFHLLAGSTDPEFANQLEVNRLDGIINAIIESYDFIIVDLGRSLSRISLPIIQMADAVVLVEGTDLSTAILTRTVWDYLIKTRGIDPRRVYSIQNWAAGLEGLTKNELEQMTGTQIRLIFPYLSSNFALANNSHEPLLTKFPNDPSSLMLKEGAIQIAELGQRVHPW